jgi:hypothetical protein
MAFLRGFEAASEEQYFWGHFSMDAEMSWASHGSECPATPKILIELAASCRRSLDIRYRILPPGT